MRPPLPDTCPRTAADAPVHAAFNASRPRPSGAGWWQGLLGVLVFSGSLPATRVAVAQIEPLALTLLRAAIAGVLAALLLAWGRAPRPQRADLRPLALTALGVVLGFPLLTALALRHIDASRSLVFIALLPLATAACAVWRAGERPRPAFWLCAALGSGLVAGFAWASGGPGAAWGDGLMLAAVAVCGLGYAEGARLSRRLGGWQVICWALLLALPLVGPLALWRAVDLPWAALGWPAALALGYVSVFSMLLGFVFWYRGLALGGIAAVGQLQLLQPFLGLGLAAMLLGEPVGWPVWAVALGVVACVAAARRVAV